MATTGDVSGSVPGGAYHRQCRGLQRLFPTSMRLSAASSVSTSTSAATVLTAGLGSTFGVPCSTTAGTLSAPATGNVIFELAAQPAYRSPALRDIADAGASIADHRRAGTVGLLLMLTGLGLVGFMVRRRKAAAAH